MYNGKELNSDFGLDWLDYGARYYDAAIGRWSVVDALADHSNQIDKSPYAYAWNNPVGLNDPDGNCPICPYIAGAIIGAGIDYASQVTVNLIQRKGLRESFTDINRKSIYVSAAAGGTGVGLMQGIKNLGRTAQVAAQVLGDTGVSITSQVINEGEVSAGNVVLDVLTGQAARRTVGSTTKAAAANSKKGNSLKVDLNTQKNIARGKSRVQGVKKSDANVKGAQNILDNYTTGAGAVGSGAAAGSTRKAAKQLMNNNRTPSGGNPSLILPPNTTSSGGNPNMIIPPK